MAPGTKKTSKVGKGKGRKQQTYFAPKKRGGTPLAAKKGGKPRDVTQKRIANNFKKRNQTAFVGVTPQYTRMKEANVKGNITAGYCAPSLANYKHPSAQTVNVNLKKGKVGKWLCGIDSALKFTERRYSNQHNEFRLFIEGAEVTKYVEGAVSWTYESTNGMNSLRFVLNNRDDAFIITPENICAGPKTTTGWRIDKSVIRGSKYIPRRGNAAVLDETAKYIIYNNKLGIVNPGGENPQIDPNTGMWLFPLNPYSCVIDKHDPVRLFVRLPHVYGVKTRNNRNKVEYHDLWMVAFTGFVKDYSWDDDPVQGSRHVNVTCYDYRGLLERMRVRVAGIGTNAQDQSSGQGSGAKPGRSNQGANGSPSAGAPRADEQFLNLAKKVGKLYEKNIQNAFPSAPALLKPYNPFQYMQSGGNAAYNYRNRNAPQSQGDPSRTSKALGLVDAFKSLFQELAKFNLVVIDKCQVKVNSGNLTANVDPACANRSWDHTTRTLQMPPATAVAGIGEIIDAAISIYWIDGTKNQLYLTGIKDDVPDIQVKNVGKDKKPQGGGNGVFAEDAVKAYKDAILEAKAYMSKKATAYYEFSYIGGQNTSEYDLEGGKQVPMPEALLYAEITTNIWAEKYDTAKGKYAAGSFELKAFKSGYDEIKAYRNSIRDPLKKLDIKIQNALGSNPYLRSRYPQFKTLTGYTNAASSEITGGQTFVGQLQALAQNFRPGGKNVVFSRKVTNYLGNALVEARADNLAPKLFSYADKRLGESDTILKAVKEDKGRLNRRLIYYATSKSGSPFQGEGARKPLTYSFRGIKRVSPVPIRNAFEQIKTQKSRIKDYKAKSWTDVNKVLQNTRLNNLFKVQKEAVETARQGSTVRPRAVVDQYGAHVEFDKKSAGLYADLVAAAGGQAHPLMGKSFEAAVELLCVSQTHIVKGVIANIGSYKRGVLDKWNRTVLFGVLGRPVTFKEVSIIGKNTSRDLNNLFSPYNVFYHMLRPADGTGAATIVQKNTSDTSAISRKSPPSYETRKTLLDQICEALDFQFFCNGMGDLIFEMPNYNAMPHDFGKVFEGAYLIAQDWIKSSVTEEATEIPTGWIVTGIENDKTDQKQTDGNVVPSEFLKKRPIIMTTLAQRMGVRVEHINIKIPGVGAPTSGYTMDQLMTYAAFYIQRQIGRSHTFRVTQPFRPYIYPNRPIYLIPRQRIGLPTSVTHTMNPPDGVCTTEANLAYTRWLFRDGTFRFVGGGTRQPMSYTQFFVGVPNYEIKEGTLHNIRNNKIPRAAGSKNSASQVAKRVRAASFFASAVNEAGFNLGINDAAAVVPNAPSGKVTETLDWKGAGYHVEGENTAKDQSKNRAAKPGKKKGSDALSRFYSPWKYSQPGGAPNYSPWRGWGYFRMFVNSNKQYKRSIRYASSSQSDYYHSGMDVLCPVGVHCLTPVDIDKASALYMAGPYDRDKADRIYIFRSQFQLFDSSYTGYTSGSRTSLENVFRIGGPIKGSGRNTEIPVSRKQWTHFSEITQNGTRLKGMLVARGSKGGFRLSTWGYAAPPQWSDRSAVVRVKMQYIHINDLVTKGGKAIGVDLIRGKPLARTGEPVCEVGCQFTITPHLHFNLYLEAKNNRSDKDIVDMTVKANQEFLMKQLIAMATGWKFQAVLAADVRDQKVLNAPAQGKWQTRRFRARILGKADADKKITVQDVVNYMKKRSVWKNATNGTKSRKYNTQYIPTNPFFYFKPEQLLDLADPKVQRHAALRRNANFSGGVGRYTGSTTYAPRRAIYDPDATTWCGSAGSRAKAGNTSRKRKANIKKNQKTTQRPQDKKKNEERTKRNLAKSSASAKAKEAAAKGDRTKIRRKVNREIKRTINAQGRAARRHPGTTAGTPRGTSG